MSPQEIGSAIGGLGIIALTAHTAWNSRKVKTTLTTNNGGSHVKDALDRIEGRQAEQDRKLDDLRADFRDHKADAGRTEDHIFSRLDRLEQGNA